MSADGNLEPYLRHLEDRSTLRWCGRVTKAVGHIVESEGPSCSLGESCEIVDSSGTRYPGEVVGFRGSSVLSMPLEKPRGLRLGDLVCASGERPAVRVGERMLGRVIDGTGRPLDGLPAYPAREMWPLDAANPHPLARSPISTPIGCGVRAIDSFLTCGHGQRVGIFGGSGVGKSTLIGMMTRGTDAEVIVLALVGERGREVREFLENVLGDAGRRRAITVVSTSDQSPVLRIRAALAATAVAEYFCAAGKQVLLVVDSLTRFAMAQREIGLAAGEPPTAKGYTPSVFVLLARMLERAGNFGRGAITAFYTVLMEGDDQNDPLVDSVRALLDGHIVLDRELATENHYPPVSILDSLSRLMPAVTSREHLGKARHLRKLLAAYRSAEDLIRVGAYARGSDRALDRAVEILPALRDFLQQQPGEVARLDQSIQRLLALPA